MSTGSFPSDPFCFFFSLILFLGLSFFLSFSPSFFFSLGMSLESLSLSFSCFSFFVGNLKGFIFFIFDGLL